MKSWRAREHQEADGGAGAGGAATGLSQAPVPWGPTSRRRSSRPGDNPGDTTPDTTAGGPIQRALARRLRVFVYDMPSHFTPPPGLDPFCSNAKMYSVERRVHMWLLHSPLRTLDPLAADLFFIPVFGTCVFHAHGHFPGAELTRDAVRWVKQAHPYFDRSAGRDHLIMASHDFSMCFEYVYDLTRQERSRGHVTGLVRELEQATVLSMLGDLHAPQCFRLGAHLVVPPYYPHGRALALIKFDVRAHRPHLAVFAGLMEHFVASYSFGVRGWVRKLFATSSRIVVRESMPADEYISYVRSSTFMLVLPGGWVPCVALCVWWIVCCVCVCVCMCACVHVCGMCVACVACVWQ